MLPNAIREPLGVVLPDLLACRPLPGKLLRLAAAFCRLAHLSCNKVRHRQADRGSPAHQMPCSLLFRGNMQGAGPTNTGGLSIQDGGLFLTRPTFRFVPDLDCSNGKLLSLQMASHAPLPCFCSRAPAALA